MLAYIKPDYDDVFSHDTYMNRIEFFIDPMSGHVFTHKDVENYFKRISVPPVASYFKPISHTKIVQTQLEELGKCFTNDKTIYKQGELIKLASFLSD